MALLALSESMRHSSRSAVALIRCALQLGAAAKSTAAAAAVATGISTVAPSAGPAAVAAARLRGLHSVSQGAAAQGYHAMYRSSFSAVSSSSGVLNWSSPSDLHPQPRRVVKTTADDVLRHQHASFSTAGGADATSAAFSEERVSSEGEARSSEEQADADLRGLILRQALSYVPKLGWSSEALAAAVNDLGLSSASIGLIQVGRPYAYRTV